MTFRFEIGVKEGISDSFGNSTLKSIKNNLGIKVESVRVLKVFTVDKQFSQEQVEKTRKELLTDPLTEHSSVNSPLTFDFDFAVEVGFLPGVKDNQGDTAREAIEDLLGVKFAEREKVYTSNLFLIKGKLNNAELKKIASSLFNPLIQTSFTKSIAEFKESNGMKTPLPIVKILEEPRVEEVNLQVSDEELVKIGKEGILDSASKTRRGPLALGIEEMKAIKDYFEKQGRNPNDIELEALAQTWSEHCKHTIFASEIDEIKEGLFKHYIKRLTEQVRGKLKEDWLVSVFSDNSGIIKFNDEWNVCFKVETHNSPSALDPYGGAITGIVGVNRDPLGTGNGSSRLIFNMYGFCFGNPYYSEELPFRGKNKQNQILHPRIIFEGVRKGVEHGGNKSGIPTPHGFLLFDDRFMGKPLVFVGTIGLMPAKLKGKSTAEKQAKLGDLIIMAGNRVGKDGIHGATFSSESLHSGSPMGAVQIGDPITQKKLADAQLEASMLGLFNSVTDNGAGGLSCSVAEMAKETNGCEVDLENVPLKYPNLPPNEIWISESQERMTYAVPKEKLEDFQIIGLPGGFSYGDDISAGKVLANKIRSNLKEQILQFINDGKLIFGFCNGFQIMVKAGLLPSPNTSLEQTVTLSNNDSGRYEDRWIFLKEQKSKCLFTKGINLINLPVAHGEGKFFADSKTLKELHENKQIVFKYSDYKGNLANRVFPLSPNASLRDIAGICDKTGRIFGMMPHPERCLSVFNLPDWDFLKEKALRSGKQFETRGDGNIIFKNAVEFVKENF